MEVTRDVILDLLPLYFSDEASEDTKALVDEHLESDPDLARLAQRWKDRLPAPPPAPVSTDAQAQAYHQAQRLITFRTIGLAALITGGVLALLALVWMFVTVRGSPNSTSQTGIGQGRNVAQSVSGVSMAVGSASRMARSKAISSNPFPGV